MVGKVFEKMPNLRRHSLLPYVEDFFESTTFRAQIKMPPKSPNKNVEINLRKITYLQGLYYTPEHIEFIYENSKFLFQ
jgi:UDP-galactopyranose mutase